MNKPILEIENVSKSFGIKTKKNFLFNETKKIKALNNVSFKLFENETLGLVGESGCGKSTLANILMRLLNYDKNQNSSIVLNNKNIYDYTHKEYSQLIQMVFQDPYSSLNPRKNIFDIISEPLIIQNLASKKERQIIVDEVLSNVGLDINFKNKYPHQLSGGQRQRIGIARSLTLKPKILILDEPVSALDVSVQAKILNLLNEVKKQYNLSLIFIGHDLSVIKHISQNILVMYLGNIMEYGDAHTVFNKPHHPYTKTLLESTFSINDIGKKIKRKIKGEIPSPLDLPSGCCFNPRCENVTDDCLKEITSKKMIGEKHISSCIL